MILSELALIRNMVKTCVHVIQSTHFRSAVRCVTWSCLLWFCICNPRMAVRLIQFSLRAFLVSLLFVLIQAVFRSFGKVSMNRDDEFDFRRGDRVEYDRATLRHYRDLLLLLFDINFLIFWTIRRN